MSDAPPHTDVAHPGTATVDVWVVTLAHCHAAELCAAYQALLSPPEVAQWHRFHFEKDRHRYLVTRALVRTTLSRLTGVPASALQFDAGPHGKPQLRRASSAAPRLAFNLSHTSGLIMLGVTQDGELGLDVEATSSPAPLEVVGQQFSQAEHQALTQLASPADQAMHFWSCWTLKESLIKATGQGLSTPLNRFGFTLTPGAPIALHGTAPFTPVPTDWWFGQWHPADAHLAALCLARPGPASGPAPLPPILRAWQTVPLQGEHAAVVNLIRASTPAGTRL